MLNNTINQLISGAINIVGTLALMLYTNVWLTIITIVMTPLMIRAGRAVAGRSRKYYKQQQAALGTLNGYIEESVTGQKVVKVFCHEEIAEEEFSYLNDDLCKKQINAQFFGGIMGPVMGNLSQVSYSLTACIGGILCVLKGFDLGGLTIFVNYSRQFSRPINEISMQVNTIFSALAGAERVFDVMDDAPENADAPEAVSLVEKDGRLVFRVPASNKDYADRDGMEVKGAVTVEHITFGYVPEKTILKDVSLYAKPGQKIAFVGSTGAGKTTITNLINRFYDIEKGRILIDGVDIKDIRRDDLRKSIAMVLQDTHLFTGTVRDNIRYGRLDASDEEVEEAARMASAHSFIMRLEHGYDTMLEGDGANLSQGQRQLLKRRFWFWMKRRVPSIRGQRNISSMEWTGWWRAARRSLSRTAFLRCAMPMRLWYWRTERLSSAETTTTCCRCKAGITAFIRERANWVKKKYLLRSKRDKCPYVRVKRQRGKEGRERVEGKPMKWKRREWAAGWANGYFLHKRTE